MRVGIIGCGLIGNKRAKALQDDDTLVCCCDVNEKIAKKFSEKYKCKYYTDYKDMLDKNLDIVIIAVINKYIKEIASAFLKLDKYVLIEKPMGRNYEEASNLLSISNKIKVGFNLRYHPAIYIAKNNIDKGKIGDILFIRAHYGHGGREGMEKEWRASKDLCGGGEMLDQGVHLVDLFRWFAGEIKAVYGKVETKYWDMEVEDTAFVHLVTERNVDIQMSTSWTTWKNTFSIEIYGKKGFIKINGLGGSYGKETLEEGIQKEKGAVPTVVNVMFDMDTSWNSEWMEFKKALKKGIEPLGNGYDGMMANKVIDAVYKSSEKKEVIYL